MQAVNLSENYANYTANSLLSVLNSYGYNTSPSNGTNSVAVGSGASATGKNSAAVGTGSSAAADNSVALGAGSTAARGAQANYKDPISGKTASSVGEVSVGSPWRRTTDHQCRAGHCADRCRECGPSPGRDLPGRRLYRYDVRQSLPPNLERCGGWSRARQSAAGAQPWPIHDRYVDGHVAWRGRMAAGGSYYMPDNSIIIKASASYGGEAGMTGGMGVGFVLN